MPIQEQMIAEIAREVVARLRVQMQAPVAIAAQVPQAAVGHDGVFATVDEAVNAAFEAQKKVAAMSFDERKRMTDTIVRICNDRREELGRMEMDETKVGRLDHKILKLTNMRFVLGVEEMKSGARSDPTGLCIIERAPWGVIGMVLPVTHSAPTMAIANGFDIVTGDLPPSRFVQALQGKKWRGMRCSCGIVRLNASWAWRMC